MNLRQVRKKIKTINNVAKITKAMQMVAAVKMKKTQQFVLAGKIYREMLGKIAQRVMNSPDADFVVRSLIQKQAASHTKTGKNLHIVIASNKGLCGSFNVNLFRFLLREADLSKDEFLVFGRKAAGFLSKLSGRVVADFSDQKPMIEAVSPIFSLIFKNFSDSIYHTIFLVYNKFISTFKITPYKTQLLPFTGFPAVKSDLALTAAQTNNYLIEPSHETVIETLLQDYIKEKIRTALLDSEAGEHAARMFAMKNATDNAADITYNLTLLRNKLRQQGITYELLNMVAAKESTEVN